MVLADKAAYNVVVDSRLYYINTLKCELVDSHAYKLQPSLSERVIVDWHGCQTALHFGVKAKENQDKVPTLYCLPKLHKNYKARFISNSSSCMTTELSKLLTSCLTAGRGLTSWVSFVVSNCEFVTFLLVSLGLLWYLIVSIPDLCTLTYIVNMFLSIIPDVSD